MVCARIVFDRLLLYQIVEHLIHGEQFKVITFKFFTLWGLFIWIFSDCLVTVGN